MIVAVIPVPTGSVKPHGLVKISAVKFVSAGIVLSLAFNIRPTIVVSAGSVTVLVINREGDEDVPNPTHPPLLTSWSVAKYMVVLPGPTAPVAPVGPVGPVTPVAPVGPVGPVTGQGQGGQGGGQGRGGHGRQHS